MEKVYSFTFVSDNLSEADMSALEKCFRQVIENRGLRCGLHELNEYPEETKEEHLARCDGQYCLSAVHRS